MAGGHPPGAAERRHADILSVAVVSSSVFLAEVALVDAHLDEETALTMDVHLDAHLAHEVLLPRDWGSRMRTWMRLRATPPLMEHSDSR